MKVREVARVITIDPLARVLLIGARDSTADRNVWIMPGGGIDDGESIREAAARELREETGIVISAKELIGPVWERRHTFTWRDKSFAYHEWYVVARLASAVEVEAFPDNPEEVADLIGVRWFSESDLATWPDLVAPRRLCELMPPILAGQYPPSPIDTGV